MKRFYWLRLLNVCVILLTFLAYVAPWVSPIRFWPMAFFGLLYPWLLLLNVLFILLWAARKNWYFLFSLGCLLLGWGHLRSVVGLSTGAYHAEDAITVLSFNAHNFKFYPNTIETASEATFAPVLDGKNVSIACFQEFPNTPNQAKPYAQYLQKKQQLPHRAQRANSELAIFSAFPILQFETVQFNSSNGYQYADLNVQGRTVRVFNVHLQSNAVSAIAEEVATKGDFQQRETWLQIRGALGRFRRAVQKRALQAELVAAKIAESPHPVIVCADLNDIPQSYTYRILSQGLQDTFRQRGRGLGFTYLGRIPGLRIDYVLVAPDWGVLGANRQRTRFSDHRAVYGTIGPIIKH